MLPLFDLRGRVAIVTGGSRGLGLEIAGGLGEAGCAVALAARRAEWLEPAVLRLTEAGITVIARSCDVADEAQVIRLVREIEDRFGRIDILINNAGATWGAPYEQMPVEQWRRVFDVNVAGTLRMTMAALPAMAARRYGKIVNIASIAGLVGLPPEILDASGYTASKGAILSMTRALARAHRASGIRVNAIAPTFFPTRMTEGLLARARPLVEAATPMGRLGREGDLRGAAVFLAAPASDAITGQVLAVDGGLTAGGGGPVMD
jgi:NAD(P)-dependent dehydrogenase (short-subunit alcohol dehydrogenase family)